MKVASSTQATARDHFTPISASLPSDDGKIREIVFIVSPSGLSSSQLQSCHKRKRTDRSLGRRPRSDAPRPVIVIDTSVWIDYFNGKATTSPSPSPPAVTAGFTLALSLDRDRDRKWTGRRNQKITNSPRASRRIPLRAVASSCAHNACKRLAPNSPLAPLSAWAAERSVPWSPRA